ncbi:FAD-dependent monooxygenase [Chondromyces crocatus]|uniref:FAD-dependent oxidoreductase n=1 Tax=Chondromyces crocatus TaxID=52 RepID=A0A0K1ED77_CHOCO|nr:FAD-dependent monooxygenase [Chondromyces crocatus]AKT38528.1 FAD-dependent oxidoreductase [Chondromyces crocatus]
MTARSAGNGRRVLIVGLGISGLATAVRLHRIGWQPVIVERAPARRKGGYFIALFGTGQASAERLGLLDAMSSRQHPRGVTYEVDRADRRGHGLSFADLPGGPRVLLRGDVENALFDALPEEVEIRFSTVPLGMELRDHGVEVTMLHTPTGATVTEHFDLLVGADGMRSTVRKLVFGPHEDFLYPLNYMVGACVMSRPVTGYVPHDGLVMAEAGRSAWVFPFANHNPAVLFSYRVTDTDAQFRRAPIESLRRAYGPEAPGPVLNQLLDEFAAAEESLFDSVDQVRMDRWHQGRIVLVGDAAWSLTLYSGMGASTGMAGSELLGHLLEQYPDDVERALATWEAKLRPYITRLQADALMSRAFFTPSGEAQRILRAAILRLARSPLSRQLMAWLTGANQLKTVDIAAL